MTYSSHRGPAPRNQARPSRFVQAAPRSLSGASVDRSFDRLRDTLHYQAAGALENAMPADVGGYDSRDVWDTLAGHLELGDAREALSMVGRGAGRELAPDRNGMVRMCWAHSSALMAVNFLTPLVSRTAPGWPCGPIRFERELRVAGVRSQVGPTLDAVITDSHGTLAIEAKLAEPWRDRAAVRISHQYDLPAARVSFQTFATLDRLRRDSLRFEFLDASQLIKHLLGIHTAIETGELSEPARLVLLFWQPTDAEPFDALFDCLRDESEELDGLLDDQPVRIEALSTKDLLDSWSESGESWLRDHAGQLQHRYDVRVIDCDDC